jgi:hypothetical protein
MSLESLAIESGITFGSSFMGAAVFWLAFCPKHRCCQFKAIRAVVERTPEEK